MGNWKVPVTVWTPPTCLPLTHLVSALVCPVSRSGKLLELCDLSSWETNTSSPPLQHGILGNLGVFSS